MVRPVPTPLIDLASVTAPAGTVRPLARVKLPMPRLDMPVLARATPVRLAMPISANSSSSSGVERPPVVAASAAVGSTPMRALAVTIPATTNSKEARGTVLAKLPVRSWSADVWLALREGGSALFGSGAAVPVYGASQSGAVLRYRLDPASAREPVTYVRAVQALDRREADLAAGVAARIIPGVPIAAHVEARASRRGERLDVRPAAFLTAGFDDAQGPFRINVRGYAQAGYVGGRDGTAFADGSVIAERVLLQSSKLRLGAGAGVWGGAQRGAARLDVGPSASLMFPLGEASGRIALDYRLRVAGNAQPASGAALTLSAGF